MSLSRISTAVCIAAFLFPITKVTAQTRPAQSIDLCEQWQNFTQISSTTSLTLDHGTLWVGTTGGLIQFDTAAYEWKLYLKTNSGLPMNSVTALTMDRAGALWIGTYDGGIARLVNNVWTVFDKSNSGLPSDYILSLTCDSNNKVWAGTDGGGIARFQNGTFTVVPLPNPPSYSAIDAMATDPSGSVWLAARAGNGYEELDKFDGTNWTNFDYNNSLILDDDYIFSLSAAKDGTIWMGCEHGEVQSFDGTNWNAWQSKPSNGYGGDSPVYGLWTDDSGAVWTASWLGTGKFYHGKWNTYVGGHSYAVLVHQGTVWFANDPGIVRLQGDSTTRFLNGASLASNALNGALAQDQSGKTWAASKATSLISIYDGTNWTSITPQSISGGGAGNPMAFAADSSGNMWIALDGVGIVRFDGTTGYVFNDTNSSLPSNSVSALSYDNAHKKLWAGTAKALAVYDGSTWKSYAYPSGFPFWNLFSGLTTDRNGTVWATIPYGSLLTFDGTTMKVIGTADGLPDDFTNGVACDTSGDIWIATNSGLAEYNNGAWTIFNTSNSPLPTNLINSVTIDTFGRVWAGTFRVGAAMYDQGTWTVFNQNNSGISDNQITWATADAHGDVWIAMESDGLAEYSAVGFGIRSPLFARDTVFQCGGSVERSLQLTGEGCGDRRIVDQRIVGNDSAYYLIAHPADTNDITLDSIVVSFAPDANRPFSAGLQITLEDGTIYTIPLYGYGPQGTTVTLAANGAFTDTIGGTLLIPIVVQNSNALSGVGLSLHYDSAMLVYQGTISRTGNSVDVPGAAWVGRSRIELNATELQNTNDTIAFARFQIFPESDPCSDVTFDSLEITGSGKNCFALSNTSTVTHLCTSIACGTDILSNFVRYDNLLSFSIAPNPAGAASALSSSLAIGPSRLDILDALGSIRKQWDWNITAQPVPISLDGLAEGLYFIRVTNGEFTRVLPLMHYDR